MTDEYRVKVWTTGGSVLEGFFQWPRNEEFADNVDKAFGAPSRGDGMIKLPHQSDHVSPLVVRTADITAYQMTKIVPPQVH